MTLEISLIEKTIIKAFTTLNINVLYKLPNNPSITYFDHLINEKGYMYQSDNYTKKVLVKDLKNAFKKIKNLGINKLIVRVSKCKYCYPTYNTYSFYNKKTNDFVVRYIIHKINDSTFFVEACNNIKPPEDSSIPF